mgnify:CR=1 FL=1
MSNVVAMNKPMDYEEKRRKKILSNGKKYDVKSIFSGGPFVVVPRRALNDKRIVSSPVKYLVLSVLCSCADNYTGVCFPTYQFIGNQLQRDQSTIGKAIRKLMDWGYIKRLRKGSPLYKNVRHKSSVYRILYDPLTTDAEVKSKALESDPELQKKEENETLKHLEKQVKKDQTSGTHRQSKLATTASRSRLIELDSNTNTIDSIIEEEITDMELMRRFKYLHLAIYQVQYIPDRKDWETMKKIMLFKVPTNILLQCMKRILEKKKKDNIPVSYPLSLILAVLEDKWNENKQKPMDFVKDLAKKFKRMSRNYD